MNEYEIPKGVVIKDWGGNDDRNSWSPTPMTDPDKQGLWKVVDSQPKNIAAKFKNQDDAQQFIKYLQKHPELKPRDLVAPSDQVEIGQLPFPPNPKTIGFNRDIAEYSNRGESQELDISGGQRGDAPHQAGAYVFYVKHAERIGRDQYSLKWGFGGLGGEYEHVTKLGGRRESDRERAGWGWEARHNDYAPEGGRSLDPTKISDVEEMRRRVEERGLVVDCAGRQQGFMLVKTRSPNNDATFYDVYVDDMDGQGWKYAFSNRFDDDDRTEEYGIGETDCCDQTERGYDDDEMRLEVRFQDQDEMLEFTAAEYKKGLPAGYRSPLQSNA